MCDEPGLLTAPSAPRRVVEEGVSTSTGSALGRMCPRAPRRVVEEGVSTRAHAPAPAREADVLLDASSRRESQHPEALQGGARRLVLLDASSRRESQPSEPANRRHQPHVLLDASSRRESQRRVCHRL